MEELNWIEEPRHILSRYGIEMFAEVDTGDFKVPSTVSVMYIVQSSLNQDGIYKALFSVHDPSALKSHVEFVINISEDIEETMELCRKHRNELTEDEMLRKLKLTNIR